MLLKKMFAYSFIIALLSSCLGHGPRDLCECAQLGVHLIKAGYADVKNSEEQQFLDEYVKEDSDACGKIIDNASLEEKQEAISDCKEMTELRERITEIKQKELREHLSKIFED